MTTNGRSEEEKTPKKPPLNNYLRYSALGFQMLASILIGVLSGMYLDVKFREPEAFPLYTIIGSLLGVFLAIYVPLRDLLKK